jgi:TRAP-type C4-dicarboxylate transport system substrate-binding protein
MRGWLVLLLALAAVGCGSSGDKAGGEEAGDTLVLTLATRDAESWDARFAREVARLSHGTMRIDVRGDWRKDEADYERRTVEDVRAGKADLGETGARVWDTVGASSFQAMLAPFLVDSEDLELRILESPLGRRMLDGLEDAGVVGIAVAAGPIRRPFGVSRSFVRVEDFAGARIGIRLGRIAKATLEALGAQPRGFVPGDLSGLDGAELDPIVVANWGADRVGSTMAANVPLWPLPSTIFMNSEAYEELTTAQRAVLHRAGRAALRPDFEETVRLQRGGLGAVCERGGLIFVHASTPDLASLRAAARPVYDELERDPLTRELLAAIQKLRAQAPLPVAPACPERPIPAPIGSAIDGRWRSTPTAAQLVAVGRSPAEAQAEQGSWIVEFRAGGFKARQVETGVEYSGFYELRGDILSLDFEVCPGTRCTLVSETRWSLFRNRLTLTEIPGRPFAGAGVAAPWTRID